MGGHTQQDKSIWILLLRYFLEFWTVLNVINDVTVICCPRLWMFENGSCSRFPWQQLEVDNLSLKTKYVSFFRLLLFFNLNPFFFILLFFKNLNQTSKIPWTTRLTWPSDYTLEKQVSAVWNHSKCRVNLTTCGRDLEHTAGMVWTALLSEHCKGECRDSKAVLSWTPGVRHNLVPTF